MDENENWVPPQDIVYLGNEGSFLDRLIAGYMHARFQ